ncbi:MAG: TldD/PmbA family protein [Desulfurococcales archaeon]|nr:TldD/PmbA family protein [Desulfurococcales archaeon]
MSDIITGLESYVEKAFRKAEELGVDFIDARIQDYRYESIVYDNDRVKSYSYTTTTGVGFRIVYKGFHGYSSTTIPTWEGIEKALLTAYRMAKALYHAGGEPSPLAEYPAIRAYSRSGYIKYPFEISDDEKIEVVKTLVSTAKEVKGVVSATARLGLQHDKRVVLNNEGTRVETDVVLTGFFVSAVARSDKGMEMAYDSKSKVSGWELVEYTDLNAMAKEIGELAVKAAHATVPEAGKYRVVLHPEVVGLLVHEALGHASEGDLVASDASVIKDKLGQKIGSDLVSIVDDGRHPDGYYVPFDDEGVEKKKTTIVENGVLKGYLAGRAESQKLGIDPTGNSRVMSYQHPLLVRQTNYYILPGDHAFDELVQEAKDGIYVTGKGARGGEVDPGAGTFTFGVGVSWKIENGEITTPLRGVTLTGMILDVLRNIEALGKDLHVYTSVFGGCGKSGQLVRVGDGGPYVLVGEIIVGGR